jgi:hypothetical protein
MVVGDFINILNINALDPDVSKYINQSIITYFKRQ